MAVSPRSALALDCLRTTRVPLPFGSLKKASRRGCGSHLADIKMDVSIQTIILRLDPRQDGVLHLRLAPLRLPLDHRRLLDLVPGGGGQVVPGPVQAAPARGARGLEEEEGTTR